MVLDYEAITAIAALATSLVAIYAVWAENRRARFSQGIDLLMRLNERFDGQDLKAYRRVAAKYLNEPRRGVPANSDSESEQLEKQLEDEGSLALDHVLDFFQYMGVLTRKKVIDVDLAWDQYFYFLNSYYVLARDYVAQCRQAWPDAWEDVDWLHQRLSRVESKRSRRPYLLPDKERLDQFLNDECSLA